MEVARISHGKLLGCPEKTCQAHVASWCIERSDASQEQAVRLGSYFTGNKRCRILSSSTVTIAPACTASSSPCSTRSRSEFT